MNRREFMEQLRRLLYDIPAKDREEALEYYEGYFDDAGAENEASVIRELGSPGRIAAEIKAGLNSDPNAGEYTDTGYHNTQAGNGETDSSYKPARYGQNSQKKRRQKKEMDSGVKTLLIIALAVISFPIWGGLLGVVFSFVMGIVGILLGLLAGTLFGGIGIAIVSVVLAVVGITNMATSFSLGLAMLGMGMALLALGIVLLVGFGWLVSKAIPALVRFLIDLFHKVFHRNRREEAR